MFSPPFAPPRMELPVTDEYPGEWMVSEGQHDVMPETPGPDLPSTDWGALEGAFTVDISPDIPEPTLRAEILFWSTIMKQHMDFYNELLDSTRRPNRERKERAARLSRDWQSFIDDAQRSGINPGILSALMARTGNFKTEVLGAIRSGAWVGSVFESFVLETLKELDYFRATLEGGLPPEEEIAYWNGHSKDHAMLNSKLLDPSEMEATLQQMQIGFAMQRLADPYKWGATMCRNMDLGCLGQYVMQSLQANQQFLQSVEEVKNRKLGLAEPRVSSVMTKEMIDHTINEVRYGLQKIENARRLLGRQ